ncbi:MAG: glycosyltransferase family 1 protein [Bacteroidota bacterium]
MRIAILCDALDLQYAGIQTYLRGLVKAVTELDRSNEYFLVRPKAGGEFENAREIIVPISSHIPGSQRLRLFTSIPKRLAAEKMDVVVEPAHFGPFNLPTHIKRVTIIHDLTPVLFPQFHPFASTLFHRFLLPHILKKADCIIANSENTKQDVVAKYAVAKGKIQVVLPGREIEFAPRKDAFVLQKYGITQPYFLYVGTLEPRKNLATLVKAYDEYRRLGGQAFQLVLVGKKGWKNEAFEAALAKSPHRKDIILTGYAERQELPVLYSMAALFIYPSLYEGFGLPVLEAMSCGVPVLISNTSSLPEVGGQAAGYFNPNSVSDLAQAMLELANDEAKRLEMSRLSLWQAEKFNWNSAVHKFVAHVASA